MPSRSPVPLSAACRGSVGARRRRAASRIDQPLKRLGQCHGRRSTGTATGDLRAIRPVESSRQFARCVRCRTCRRRQSGCPTKSGSQRRSLFRCDRRGEQPHRLAISGTRLRLLKDGSQGTSPVLPVSASRSATRPSIATISSRPPRFPRLRPGCISCRPRWRIFRWGVVAWPMMLRTVPSTSPTLWWLPAPGLPFRRQDCLGRRGRQPTRRWRLSARSWRSVT